MINVGVVALVLLMATSAWAEPLLTPAGEPLVCVYYFGHWWSPWKDSDDAIRTDFKRLADMGVTAVCVDHEWSQAIDGDWRWLDREHRLAKQAGVGVAPWLSLKTWSDVDGAHRLALAKRWYGVEIPRSRMQAGGAAPPPVWHHSVVEFGARYACDYVRRYRNQGLLRVRWGGRVRPVISLSVESAWVGGFDDASNARFRAWLARRYSGVKALNARWGTTFATFEAVDPRDTTVFNYTGHISGKAAHPNAVEDHVAFRAETISQSLAAMGAKVRATWPDVLLLAEIPYQYGSGHPHAVGYRIGYGANPESCDYADIVMIRCTGPLNDDEITALSQARRRTGQRFILSYRTYATWGDEIDDAKHSQLAAAFATQAATVADGLGFYSWNEMVDVHLAFAPEAPNPHNQSALSSQRAIALVKDIVRRYRANVRADRSATYPTTPRYPQE